MDFDRHAVHDGDEVTAGRLRIRAVATPGHTDTHLAYLIDAPQDAPHEPPAVFTGGSLLYGSVGRTDLVDPARTAELTRAQFRSVRHLAGLLDDDARVFPTHGFGSFCSSGSSSARLSSTMGQERARNDALTGDDEDAFVARLVAGLTAYPRYYAHMGARNRQGPRPADLSAPEPVEPDELPKRIAAGQWVVDLRDRTAYAAEHLAGSIGIALGQQFSTYLGWLIPWGTPLTLIGDRAQQVADAQRQLVRIGIDRPAGAAVGTPGELAAGDDLRSYRRATFADLAAQRTAGARAGAGECGCAKGSGAGPVVLDVRRDDERAIGHVPGSVHVPLHSLLERLDEVPDGPLWVHCATGYRAAIAASLLDRAGHDVVLIDDEYATAVKTGLATG